MSCCRRRSARRTILIKDGRNSSSNERSRSLKSRLPRSQIHRPCTSRWRRQPVTDKRVGRDQTRKPPQKLTRKRLDARVVGGIPNKLEGRPNIPIGQPDHASTIRQPRFLPKSSALPQGKCAMTGLSAGKRVYYEDTGR
jgi:hypothetical protein